MNRSIYFLLVFLAAAVTGCSKTDYLLYNDSARVQLNDTTTVSSTFVYEPAAKIRDTVYIRVNTIGKIANYDRAVKLVQVAEKNEPNPAVSNVHYVSMDDPSLKNAMVIKANAVSALIPVVLLRDVSLKDKSYHLRLQLAANDQFGLGEIQKRSCAIIFSDRLERFYSWRFDTSVAPAFITFGKYSTRKHQFMIDNLHQQIDEAWYQAAVNVGELTHYKNFLKDKLNTFNTDPGNLQSGAAPMHETSDNTSPLLTFP